MISKKNGGQCPPEVLGGLAQRVDYAEYGGAPLLGVKGPYVIGHGRSDGRAFFNAVRAVHAYLDHHVGERTVEELAAVEPTVAEDQG